MSDRVVDECNPDAHLSMKDVTNLCWDDEKESEVKDFSNVKDKYIDIVMQKVCTTMLLNLILLQLMKLFKIALIKTTKTLSWSIV